MNKMLVSVFDNETQAYEGLKALKDLHAYGDITLYAAAVISKDDNGQLQLDSAADKGSIGTTTGLLAGSLIGLFGGPVGLAVGAATGTIAGLIFDASTDDINTKFLDEVSSALSNGKTAVIAEIDETWTVPVDTKMEAINGIVFRRLKYEVVDDQLTRESAAIAAEFEALKEELKEAREEDKVKINAAIAKLKSKAQALNEQAQRKMNDTKSEFDAKINAMQEQLKGAKERRKDKIEKRMDVVQGEYNARTKKLKQAVQLVGEAFSTKENTRKQEMNSVF